VIAAQLS